MAIIAKYVGNGDFLNGVPARDLMDVDWAQLDDEQRKRVEGSGLYEEVVAEGPAPMVEVAPPDAEETAEKPTDEVSPDEAVESDEKPETAKGKKKGRGKR